MSSFQRVSVVAAVVSILFSFVGCASAPVAKRKIASTETMEVITPPKEITLSKNKVRRTAAWLNQLKYVEVYSTGGGGATYSFSNTKESRDCKPLYVGMLAGQPLQLQVKKQNGSTVWLTFPVSTKYSNTLVSKNCDGGTDDAVTPDLLMIEMERDQPKESDSNEIPAVLQPEKD